MKATLKLLWVIALVLSAGCAVAPSSYGSHDASMSPLVRNHVEEQVSLFSTDSDVLSDQDIARILAYSYIPPAKLRVGVLALNESRWAAWSSELEATTADIQAGFVTKLMDGGVHEASFLPSLLVPQTRTVGHFREAAARYQADMLVIYRPSCRSYAKYRVFSANTSRSYCTVEAVLLDTRTGIVPFATTESREFSADAADSEISFQETLRRAELGAVRESLSTIAGEVTLFLRSAGQ